MQGRGRVNEGHDVLSLLEDLVLGWHRGPGGPGGPGGPHGGARGEAVVLHQGVAGPHALPVHHPVPGGPAGLLHDLL